MRKLLALSIVIVMAGLAGCPKISQTAYDLIVGAKAFTDKVASEHPECANGATTTVCTDLKKAVAAKDLLIDATEGYCAGPDFNSGGSCNPPAKGTPAETQATAKLQSAIAGWNQAATDLKGASQ